MALTAIRTYCNSSIHISQYSLLISNDASQKNLVKLNFVVRTKRCLKPKLHQPYIGKCPASLAKSNTFIVYQVSDISSVTRACTVSFLGQNLVFTNKSHKYGTERQFSPSWFLIKIKIVLTWSLDRPVLVGQLMTATVIALGSSARVARLAARAAIVVINHC